MDETLKLEIDLRMTDIWFAGRAIERVRVWKKKAVIEVYANLMATLYSF